MKRKPAVTITLYALSTCFWCRKTKNLLDSLKIEYTVHFVDLLKGRKQSEALAVMRKGGAKEQFPMLFISGKRAVTGFDEEKIRKAVK
jgi:glutaredoxin